MAFDDKNSGPPAASFAARQHVTVSGYPLDEQQIDRLRTDALECVLNWSTRDGWPVGVLHSFVWHNGRFWLTMGAHRHRVSAIRRDPRVSVVVSSAATSMGYGQSFTAKGRAVIHEDRETKDWFYPAFAGKTMTHEAADQHAKDLDSPLRVIIEVIPEKWITFDMQKMILDLAGELPDDQRGSLHESDTVRLERELKRRGLA
jgi:nitroimidazol reductase NimA-like FMN-containing flavoprotein (pyridoxamine 5'-phosphate oxidase superfamily)